jgi:Leucine rich repeat
MASMGLSAIPADLPNSLTDLDLSFNGITHIETGVLSNLCHLTSLSLYSNRVSQLASLPALPALVHISLGVADDQLNVFSKQLNHFCSIIAEYGFERSGRVAGNNQISSTAELASLRKLRGLRRCFLSPRLMPLCISPSSSGECSGYLMGQREPI